LVAGGADGEDVHDGKFGADVLMGACLVPHPAMQEVEWVYRPVTGAKKGSKLVITNRRSFTDLSDLEARWELNIAGDIVSTGALEVPTIAPHAIAKVALPCAKPSEAESHLTLPWTQRAATEWAAAGTVVARDQVQLRPPKLNSPPSAPSARGANESSSPSDRGVDTVLAAPVTLSIFRAPVDNDGYKLMPEIGERHGIGGKALGHWQDHGMDRKRAEEFVEHDHRIDLLDDGSQVHHHVVDVPDSLFDLGRVGVTFDLVDGFDQVRWFGRGQLENYPDRNRGAMIGTWQGDVDTSPYLVPQEFGLRTDCRWFEFVNSTTRERVRLDVLRPTSMHISATRFSAGDLYEVAHETDLVPRSTRDGHADVCHVYTSDAAEEPKSRQIRNRTGGKIKTTSDHN